MAAKLVPENVVISDATVLINFLNTGTFQLLLQIFEGRLHVTDLVRGEIKVNRKELDDAIANRQVLVHKVPIEQIEHLIRSYSEFHPGEASCFVLAKEQSWKVATDDTAAKQLLKRELGPSYVVTTFDILLQLVHFGRLGKVEALELLNRMEENAHFQFVSDEFKRFEKYLRTM